MIGSGFAGAVTACRLTQAKERICILERGRRYGPQDLPVYPPERPSLDSAEREADCVPPDFSRCFWALGQGLWDVQDLGDVVVAQAAGFGGGSLIYANVHLRAPTEVFDDWPEPYRRGALEPYYDLAAYMLDVKPMPADLEVPKRSQLRRAAEKLQTDGDDPQPRVWHFEPPLAINFPADGKPDRDDQPRVNRWGREQRTCDLRGDCCFGCEKQAKNTLDLNYLAIAEDAGKYGADVRTLAEAVSIECVSWNGKPVYQVEYRDHLFGGRVVSVQAGAVFLCAGAVNTTELLMRCRQADKLKLGDADLGTRYCTNVDTLAAVFDCDELQELDRGPTITGGLLYSRESDAGDRARSEGGARDWLLIQDGGMPTALEPLLGFFRSPLWARRNRYREGPVSRDSKPGTTTYADLPFAHAVDVLAGLTRSAVPPGSSQALAIAERMRAGPHGRDPAGPNSWDLLPEKLAKELRATRRELVETLGTLAAPLVDELLVEAAQKVELRYGDLGQRLGAEFPIEGLATADMGDLHLARRVLRLAVQLIWGSEAGMVEALAALLQRRLAPEGIIDRVADLLRGLLDYRLGDGHTGLLLSMGRDSCPGELRLAVEEPCGGNRVEIHEHATATLLGAPVMTQGSWGDLSAEGMLLVTDIAGEFKAEAPLVVNGRVIGTCASEPTELVLVDNEATVPRVWALRFTTLTRELPNAPLRASLPDPLESPERGVQERLLRDIAGRAWDGELRTNPAWNFMGRRVTVHSQGGSPMQGVTDASGEVIGCKGLYVMDAAAFPTAVGVNPSATIAAVAEYKVERYIRERLYHDGWRAPEFDDARKWAGEALPSTDEQGNGQRIRRDELDPLHELGSLRGAPAQSAPPHHGPVGIAFKETMEGFHAPWEPLPPETDEVEACRSAERRGLAETATIDTTLAVEVADLTVFLEAHRQACGEGPRKGKFPKMAVSGTVGLVYPGGTPAEGTLEAESSIQLIDPTPGHGREERILRYELLFPLAGKLHLLRGKKYIRDDPSFDVWQDAATLFFEVFRRQERWDPVHRGILRLPASDFLEKQIGSFTATNTEDPVRQAWALAAFGRYFLGNLMDVYVPEVGRVADFAKNMLGRTHV